MIWYALLRREQPVTRSHCYAVEPDSAFPARCTLEPHDEGTPHNWGATHGAFLGPARRAELADTPSDRLPVRERWVC